MITKLLYLLNQGETFTKKEASEVFFAATKLFQSKDPHLRRMVYLCIKVWLVVSSFCSPCLHLPLWVVACTFALLPS